MSRSSHHELPADVQRPSPHPARGRSKPHLKQFSFEAGVERLNANARPAWMRYFEDMSSDDEEDSSLPVQKRAPRPEATAEPATLAEALNVIRDLKLKVMDLQDYIVDKNLLSDAPETVRNSILEGPRGAFIVAKSIENAMENESNRLVPLLSQENGITCDQMSEAMVPYLNKIYQLSKLEQPKSLELAYNLVVVLSDCSYAEDFNARGDGNRPSDEPADELLRRLAIKRRRTGELWDLGTDLEFLIQEKDYLAASDLAIEPWFPKTIQLFEEWLAEEE